MKRIIVNPQILIGVLALLVLAGGSFPAYTILDIPYWKQKFSDSLSPPSYKHLMGTDQLGRDIFSRTMYGARISLLSAIGAASLAGIVGVLLGLTAGYFGGLIDRFVQTLIDMCWCVPTIVVAIFLTTLMNPGLMTVVIAITFGYWAQYARVIRGEVLSLKNTDYVQAARALGSSNMRIIFSHIFPNVVAPLVVLISLTIGYAIIIEAMLGFLGVGVQPPIPSWGRILSSGREFLSRAPWITIFPGIMISLTVLAFNLLGDGLRDVLDPKLRV